MRIARNLGVVLVVLALVTLAACSGGGGSSEIVIVNIYTNPTSVTAGSTVELTASISAPGQTLSSLQRYWAVSDGSLAESEPDIYLTTRETAADGDYADELYTTSTKVYWVAPATPGTYTITLEIEDESKTISVIVSTSQVAMSIGTDGDGNTVCTVAVNDIDDLYQAAFRIYYSSAWTPISAEAGDFLGGEDDILWLGLTNQSGFVPCAITRKGSADGVDGSGTLATITFQSASSTSSTREAESIPFEVSMVQLRDANGELISGTE